jgi:sec-independent protein translocase protein TatA
MTALAIGGLGTPELLIIVGVIILMVGGAKLPELARGSGRALRIFKDETKGLGDAAAPVASEQRLDLRARERDLADRQAALDAEAARLERESQG